jgi:arylsulfatase A-like enzyme
MRNVTPLATSMHAALLAVKLATGWLASGLFATALLPFAVVQAADPGRPNVLLVITDDQGYGDVSLHGNPVLKTPQIDDLARRSLRLTNFHVDPTCAETRAALMSGRYPLRGGVWHTIMGRSILDASTVTMPQLFQQAGYRTGMFGKWHLGDNYPYRPQDRGFDRTLHHGGGGVGQVPDVWGNDYFDDVYWSGNQLTPVRGYCTDQFFSAASEFMAEDASQPFFCYLATNAPHAPYRVPESYKKPYLDQGVPEPMASFYGMIANIDENLGRLLKVLEQTGQRDNTVIVFMTDNGTAAGYMPATGERPAAGFNAGMRGLKGSQFDGGHRVPCFIHYPQAMPVDREYERLTAHYDLLPTLAALCRLDASAAQPLDGVDLGPLVRGEQPASDRTLVVQSHRVEEPQPWRKSVVMTERWRLVDGTELYDIKADPAQSKNVATANAGTVTQLRAAYQKWWQEMRPDPARLARIPLGAAAAERVRLTAHDWHGPAPVFLQDAVRQDPVTDGYWAVRVEQPGVYQFLLARRPLAEPAPVDATSAVLEIGSVKVEVPSDPGTVLVPITVRLQPGDAQLSARFLKAGRDPVGAYFVDVHYLGDVPQRDLDSAAQRLPAWLHPGDRVAWLGGTLIERLGETGALDAEILLRAPLSGLTFINLGWSGDDFSGRARGVFGGPDEGRKRRLRDLEMSGASVVVLVYGMSELLDPSLDSGRLATHQAELERLLGEIRSQGRRAVLCLPPEIHHDGSNAAGAGLSATAKPPSAGDRTDLASLCSEYNQRRPQMNAMLQSVAEQQQLAVVELAPLATSMFESGTYLSAHGYRNWALAAADSLLHGAEVSGTGSRSNENELRVRAAESARLFFDMHRPQNETYLLLFRKHEQGNNAVEIDQYRPLVAEQQLDLLHQAARAP